MRKGLRKQNTVSMANLRIIADDFGLHQGVNEGIELALKKSWINGVSIMANGEAFDDAVLRLKGIEKPNVGAHLVLVGEKSLSNDKNLPSSYKAFFLKYILGTIKASDIEKEFRIQLERILNSGVNLSFINSHQHLHLLPAVMNIVIKLSKEYGIGYVRTVREPISKAGLFRMLELLVLRFLSQVARVKIQRNNLKTNDFFIGFLHAGNLSQSDFEKAVRIKNRYVDAVVELNTHPGNENDDLRGKYSAWGNYSWQEELNLLKSFSLNNI
jgi:chitin disaccharide deacetylase